MCCLLLILRSLCHIYLFELLVCFLGIFASLFFYNLEPFTLFLWWLCTSALVIWFIAELVEITYVPSECLRCCNWYALAAAAIFLIIFSIELAYCWVFWSISTVVFQALCGLVMVIILIIEFFMCGDCIEYLKKYRIFKCKMRCIPCCRIMPSICDRFLFASDNIREVEVCGCQPEEDECEITCC